METSNITRSDVETAHNEQLHVPLVEDQYSAGPGKPKKKPAARKAIRKTFKLTGHLSNLLPTGSVLAFQILSPALTHEGKCNSILSKFMTLCLIGLCGISCVILCVTDSVRDERGKVRYGIATLKGLKVIDGAPPVTISPQDVEKYKLKFVDFFHGFLSLVVFGAVALFNENVVKCFYPEPSDEAKEYLTTLPVAAGIICSLLFIVFPTKRHGIGFPLSKK